MRVLIERARNANEEFLILKSLKTRARSQVAR